MGKLEKLGSLWKNKDKNGKDYFSGNIEGIGRIMIMQNGYKRDGRKDPDYIAYKAEPKEAASQSEFTLPIGHSDDDEGVPF